jgi:hypothetical protein
LILLGGALATLAAMASAPSAHAEAGYLNTWGNVYPNSSSGGNCQLCHGSNTQNINPYGFAVAQCAGNSGTITQRIQAAEGLNSDGDAGGFSNLEEIDANTQPGWTSGANNIWNRGSCVAQGSEFAPIFVGTLDPGAANVPPIASAGADQTVDVGSTVRLDGSGSTDADGDSLTFSWAVTDPTGSAVALSDSAAVSPTFVADAEGAYTAELVVDDGIDSSTPDSAVITAEIVVVNTPPVANAGPDQTVDVGVTVMLDGSGSSDADGDPLTFSWTVTDPVGDAVVLSDSTAVSPTFVADAEGTYTAELTVDDGVDSSTPDSAVITAEIVVVNTPPVANAGLDQNVAVNDTVTLDGGVSSDADGDPLTFSWSLTTVPAGSATPILSDPTAVMPTFVADAEGDYVAQLIVNDGTEDGAPDTVMITASTVPVNNPPVANAGLNQSVFAGNTTVTLDGSASSDSDGDPITYFWSFVSMPAGSAATLFGATAVDPTFVADVAGDYVVQLIVNDGMDDSAADSVVIMAAPPVVNQRPAANAGPDQTVDEGDVVTLDGGASSDPDGDLVTYSWSFTSRPTGSGATLSGATAAMPSFVADMAGTYVVQLIVNDGELDSAPDTVTITAAEPPVANQPPVANAGPDQSVNQGDPVTVDGSGSSDPDGDPLTYSWSLTARPAGSGATLSDATAVNPSFVADAAGTYVVQLIVDDGEFASAPDSAGISAIQVNPPGPGGDELRITEAEWDDEESELQVEGSEAPRGATVSITNADTGKEIGTARVNEDGRWELENRLDSSSVPCRVRAAAMGKSSDAKDVEDAPANCDDGTDPAPDPDPVTIRKAEWDDEDSELKVKGIEAPPGTTVIITNAKTGKEIGTARVNEDGRWELEKMLEPGSVPCRVRAAIDQSSGEKDVEDAPDNCR